MNIRLKNVLPVPLRDTLLHRKSDVWNTDIQFLKGERIKIKAPSGTGKTTLVHIIYKMRLDYTGEIYYDASLVRSMPAASLSDYRQQSISVIFQDMRLFSQLTARENIELKRVMHQPPLQAEGMIESMAEKLGISHILAQTAGTCSYGEQQRIAIIRSLMQPFDWLIMDEPFSHLDEANTAKAISLIDEECAKRSAGFILTDLDEDQNFSYSRQLSL